MADTRTHARESLNRTKETASDPVSRTIDNLFASQEQRFAHLIEFADRVRHG